MPRCSPRGASSDGAVALANPLSAELGVMRTALLPGLVAALARNPARQQPRVRLFELGNVFAARRRRGAARDAAHRRRRLRRVRRRAVGRGARDVGFLRPQGRGRSLLALAGATLEFRPSHDCLGTPGPSARRLARRRARCEAGLDRPPASAPATGAGPGRRSGRRSNWTSSRCWRDRCRAPASLSKFPSRAPRPGVGGAGSGALGRRFAPASGGRWRAVCATWCCSTSTAGPGLETGSKSLAMGLILQEDSRTLTDADADAVVAGGAGRPGPRPRRNDSRLKSDRPESSTGKAGWH